MRRIDAWLGIPACILLTVWRRCRDWFGLRQADRPARSVVIVKLAEQGATVLAYPALRRVTELVGRDRTYFVLFEENRFILEVMDLVPPQNIIAIRTTGIWALLSSTLVALRRLRRAGVDAALDFEFFARSSVVLTFLSGARRRVGLHGLDDGAPYRGDLLTHRLRYDPGLHTSRCYLAMVEALSLPGSDLPDKQSFLPAIRDGVPAPLRTPSSFVPRVEEEATVRSRLEAAAGTTDFSPLVLLNANASDLLPMRRWPPERYVELARQLIARDSQIHVAFTGSAAEKEEADRLVAQVASCRCFSLAGQTTLRELLVLYTLADLLVTNDSGPAHFAALTPICVVTLFGPETPTRFGSLSPRSRVLRQDMPCSPCVDARNNRLSTCRQNRCLQRIEVAQVLDLAAELLGRAGLSTAETSAS